MNTAQKINQAECRLEKKLQELESMKREDALKIIGGVLVKGLNND